MSLGGQAAIVTGGSRGIGRAIALALAEAGARVAICHAGDAKGAAEVLARINTVSQGLAIEADVSDEAAVEALFEAATAAFGPPQILVNNAGILHAAPLAETQAEDFDRVVAVNLRGSFLCARAFVRRSERGRILNVASDLGRTGREEMSAYTASKGGILALTKSLALELAPAILVNAIAPGPVETDMTAGMTPGQRARDLSIPLGRYGRPDEIAALAVFLAGPEAGFITGQCYGVDGGSAMT